MPHEKVKTDIVIEKVMNVFRSVGYDGASMAQLASATGLQKASLYYRFPEGKTAMANAVLNHLDVWSEREIFEVLWSSEPAVERLDVALNAIYIFYDGGRVACILRALSHGAAAELFRSRIADVFEKWIAAFAHLAKDMGHDAREAKWLGESVPIKIQGSLIIAQTLQKPDIFREALNDIKVNFLR